MAKFEDSEEETCTSVAPWLDDAGKPVRCCVPKHEVHEIHGGNGWSWRYSHEHIFEFVELDTYIYAWLCSCGEIQFLD